MQAFLVSTAAVTLGELGDKTQLLALVLAARFRKPVPIVLGILVATIVNHGLAASLGAWVRHALPPEALRIGLGLSFLGVAIWALIPDRLDEEEASPRGAANVFLVTLVSFFIAEIGDKTQLATVMLAAKYDALFAVVAGTTLGMLIADVPAVWLGRAASPKLPLRLIRYIAASVFALLGVGVLLRIGYAP